MSGYGWRKPKKDRRKSRRQAAYPRFDRVTAEIKIEETKEVHNARVMISDLSPGGVGLFVGMPLKKGDQLALVIEQPKHLYVKGEVRWCKHYKLGSRIISTEDYPYRVGVKFHFDTNEEREAIRQYCDELLETEEDGDELTEGA